MSSRLFVAALAAVLLPYRGIGVSYVLVLLAAGADCPVQMFRLGTRQYATQFHPELDQAGILERLEIYRDHGYFAPGEYEPTVAGLAAVDPEHPRRILANFRTLFG